MSFNSIAVRLQTTSTEIYQMPAYEKTEDGEYAILPKSGAARLAFHNTAGSAQEVDIRVKTIFDLEPVSVGTFSIAAGETKEWPVPLSLGPGDFIVAFADTANAVVVSGSIVASPISPETAVGETIWTPFLLRRPIDHTIAWAVASRTYGAAAAGGYFAGVIDTITGTIDAADEYQTGEKYALLVSPKSLEYSGRQWDTRGDSSPIVAGTQTRWNGLGSTDALIAEDEVERQVFQDLAALRISDAPPSTEGGSDIYVPALDELELLYRNLKPNAANNRTDNQVYNGATFPSTPVTTHGTNPSSLPTGAGYANNPRRPDETPLQLFRAGGSQTLSLARYWTSTEANTGGLEAGQSFRAWLQNFTDAGREGYQGAGIKDNTGNSMRPVRRVAL